MTKAQRDILAEGRNPDAPGVVVRYRRSAPKDADCAVCLDCPAVLGSVNNLWPPATTVSLHKNGIGHVHVYTARTSVERELVPA